jgi:acyl-CoA thioester hydrolase
MARIIITYEEKTLFTHDLTVRVKDLNIGNHLAHDSVISLLHEARAQFFVANNMSELDVEGFGIIMADIGVNYRSEAFFGQMLSVEIALGDFSAKGGDMYYRMSCKETSKVVAIAKTGLVFFDYEAKKPVAVPQSFLDIAK